MHFCVVNSKTIKYIIAVFLVAIILSISVNGSASAGVFFGYSSRLVPVYEVDTNEKKVALSFDAAWGADKTEGIINILKEYNVTATFFLVGFWVDKYPELVKKIDDAGLEIGNHSDTHPDLTTVSNTKLQEEIQNTSQRITKITGKEVKVFRCPYGAYNNNVITAVQNENLVPVQWSVDSLDWQGLSADAITQRVVNNVKNGSIILCHNNADNVLDATVMILDWLLMQGYKVVSVGELVYLNDYTIDRNGIQHLKV